MILSDHERVFLWTGPFGQTRISHETMKAYGCEHDIRTFDPVLLLHGYYPRLAKLGEHINVMQEYQSLRGGTLTVI